MDKITLTKKQAIRAIVYLEELEYLFTEQLWDEHHPLGSEGKREFHRLIKSIRKKVQRLTKRAADASPKPPLKNES